MLHLPLSTPRSRILSPARPPAAAIKRRYHHADSHASYTPIAHATYQRAGVVTIGRLARRINAPLLGKKMQYYFANTSHIEKAFRDIARRLPLE